VAALDSDPLDYSARYNATLTPEEEAKFQAWAKDHPKQARDTYDYDVRGAWKANLVAEPGKHGTDRFKKPNHPTFSTQSDLNGKEGLRGGVWGEDKSGQVQFTPSKLNLQMHSPEELARYFKEREPGVKLVLPEDHMDSQGLMTKQPDGSYEVRPGGAPLTGTQGIGVLNPASISANRAKDPALAMADAGSSPTLTAAANAAPLATAGGKPGVLPNNPAQPQAAADPKAKAMTQKAIDDSTHVVKTASPKVARDVTQQFREMGVDIAAAYNEMIKKLGGFKTPDLKMSESDKGLFLMDFGLRLMANSNGYWTENVGKAGMGTLADYKSEMDSRTKAATDYNTELGKTAGALAERQNTGQMAALGDTSIVGDAQGGAVEYNPSLGVLGGAYNPDTGAPLNATGPRGAAGRAPPRPLAVQVKYQMLLDAGYTPARAAETAISGLTDDKKWMDAMKGYLAASQYTAEFNVDGRVIPKDQMTDEDINKWIAKTYKLSGQSVVNPNPAAPGAPPGAAPALDPAYEAKLKEAGVL